MKYFGRFYLVGVVFMLLIMSCDKSIDIIQVKSPDGTKSFNLLNSQKNNTVTFSITYNNRDVILPSSLMLISNDINFKNRKNYRKYGMAF